MSLNAFECECLCESNVMYCNPKIGLCRKCPTKWKDLLHHDLQAQIDMKFETTRKTFICIKT